MAVIGSLGVVLRSKQRGLLDEARPWVERPEPSQPPSKRKIRIVLDLPDDIAKRLDAAQVGFADGPTHWRLVRLPKNPHGFGEGDDISA